MREPPSLADLAREPARIDEVPPKDAGRLLAELSSLALAVSARSSERFPSLT